MLKKGAKIGCTSLMFPADVNITETVKTEFSNAC